MIREAPKIVDETWSKTFTQVPDGSASGTTQTISILQDDCGGGPYFVIETERWAFDTLDELIEMLVRAGVPPSRAP